MPRPRAVLFDVIATIFAILATRRVLEASRRRAQDHPSVSPETFERWRRGEIFAHRLAANASVLKVLTGAAEYVFAPRYVPAAIERGIGWVPYAVGWGVLLGWLVALVVSRVLAARSRREAERLGIDLLRATVAPKV